MHKGSVAFYNLFILEVCNLYFLHLDYWLLRGLAQANITVNRLTLLGGHYLSVKLAHGIVAEVIGRLLMKPATESK